jgi:hypothetical protein
MRDDWRHPDLQTVNLMPPTPCPKTAGGEADDDAAPLLLTASATDEQRIAQIDEHRDGRVRDDLQLDEAIRSTTETGHAERRYTARPRRDRDIHHSRGETNRLDKSHAVA